MSGSSDRGGWGLSFGSVLAQANALKDNIEKQMDEALKENIGIDGEADIDEVVDIDVGAIGSKILGAFTSPAKVASGDDVQDEKLQLTDPEPTPKPVSSSGWDEDDLDSLDDDEDDEVQHDDQAPLELTKPQNDDTSLQDESENPSSTLKSSSDDTSTGVQDTTKQNQTREHEATVKAVLELNEADDSENASDNVISTLLRGTEENQEGEYVSNSSLHDGKDTSHVQDRESIQSVKSMKVEDEKYAEELPTDADLSNVMPAVSQLQESSEVPQAEEESSEVPQAEEESSEVPQAEEESSEVPQAEEESSEVPQAEEESSEVPQAEEESSEVPQAEEESSEVLQAEEESSEVLQAEEESSEVLQAEEESSEVLQAEEESSEVLQAEEESSEVLQAEEESSEVPQAEEESSEIHQHEELAQSNQTEEAPESIHIEDATEGIEQTNQDEGVDGNVAGRHNDDDFERLSDTGSSKEGVCASDSAEDYSPTSNNNDVPDVDEQNNTTNEELGSVEGDMSLQSNPQSESAGSSEFESDDDQEDENPGQDNQHDGNNHQERDQEAGEGPTEDVKSTCATIDTDSVAPGGSEADYMEDQDRFAGVLMQMPVREEGSVNQMQHQEQEGVNADELVQQSQNSEIHRLVAICDKLKSELKQSQEKCTRLEKLNFERERQLANAAQQNANHVDEIESVKLLLRKEQSKNEKLKAQVDEVEQRADGLLKEGMVLSKKQGDAEQLARKLRKENKVLSSKLESKVEELAHSKAQYDKVKEELRALGAVKQRGESSIAELAGSKEKLGRNLEEAQSKLRISLDRQQELQNALDEAWSELTERKKNEVIMKQEVANAQQEVQKVHHQLAEQLNSSSVRTDRVSVLEKSLAELRQEMLQQSQEASITQDGLRREIKMHMQRVHDAERRYEELIETATKDKQQILKQMQEMTAVGQHRGEYLEAEHSSLLSRAVAAEKAEASAMAAKREAEGARAQLVLKVAEMEASLGSLEVERTRHLSEIQRLQSDLSRNKQEFADLTMQLEQERESNDKRVKEMRAKEARLRQGLVTEQERFDQTVQELKEQLTETEAKYDSIVQAFEKHKLSHATTMSSQESTNAVTGTGTRGTSLDAETVESDRPKHDSSKIERPFEPISQEEILENSLGAAEHDGTRSTLRNGVDPTAVIQMQRLQLSLKQAQGEVAGLREQLSAVERSRDALAEDLVRQSENARKAKKDLEALEELREQLRELSRQKNVLLEMVGERDESIEDLRESIKEQKQYETLVAQLPQAETKTVESSQ